MIAKCANQKCGQPFLFLRGGKLFLVDGRANPQPWNPGTSDQVPRQLQHFWLCEDCAATMTLVVGQGSTPAVVVTTGEAVPSAGKRMLRRSHGAPLDQAPLR